MVLFQTKQVGSVTAFKPFFIWRNGTFLAHDLKCGT